MTRPDDRRIARRVGALVAVVALAHAPALLGPFVLDDRLLIIENPRLGDLASVLGFFSEPVTAHLPGGASNVYYRPLSFLSLWIDRQIWGDRPFGFHLTNLLLHLASTLLVYRLVSRWTGRHDAAPLAVAGIWALLPVNVEPVAYIAARHDALFTVLYLAALDIFTAGRHGWRLAVFPVVAVGAFISKEMAVTLPAAAILWELLVPRAGSRDAPRDWRSPASRKARIGVCGLTLVALLGIRLAVVAGAPGEGSEPATPDLLLVGSVAWHYVTILAQPLAYSIDRSNDVTASVAAAALSVVCAAGLAVALWLGSRRAPPATRRLVLFAALWAVVAYAPVSNVVPLYSVCADRYLYLPSLGLVLAVFAAIAWRPLPAFASPRVRLVAGVTAGVLLLALTWCRSTFFTSESLLYGVSLRSSESAMLRNNHGLVLRKRGDASGAARELRRALEIAPSYHRARFNLGVVAREQGDLDTAEEMFAAYVEAVPADPDGSFQWGLAALAREEFVVAAARLERADRLRPRHLGTRYHLAIALEQDGKGDRALELLENLAPRDRMHPRIRELTARLRRNASATSPPAVSPASSP